MNVDLPTLARTVGVGICAYAGIIVLLRAFGKRTLAKWNAFDFVVTIALGSCLATTVVSGSTTLVQGLVALCVLMVLQFLISWVSVRSRLLRRLVKSEPVVLLFRGAFCEEALLRERVTESEVRAALRQEGIADMAEAGAVVLETDGSFSVLRALPECVNSTLSDVQGLPSGAGAPTETGS